MAPSSTRMRLFNASAKAERVSRNTDLVIAGAAYSEVFPLPVGERVRVRGFLTRSRDDRLQDAVNIAQHIVVPKAQHQISVGLELRGALRILGDVLGVLTAVQLHDQPSGFAAKIDHVSFDRHLPPEFHSVKPPVAQSKPKRAFGIRLIAPQSPRRPDTRHHNPSPALASLGHPLPTGEGKRQRRSAKHNHYAASRTAGRRPSRWQIA